VASAEPSACGRGNAVDLTRLRAAFLVLTIYRNLENELTLYSYCKVSRTSVDRHNNNVFAIKQELTSITSRKL